MAAVALIFAIMRRSVCGICLDVWVGGARPHVFHRVVGSQGRCPL